MCKGGSRQPNCRPSDLNTCLHAHPHRLCERTFATEPIFGLMTPSPPSTSTARHTPAAPPTPVARLARRGDADRVARVRETGLIDHPEEDAFARLARLGASVVGAPMAFVVLVDADRDVVLSSCGLPAAIRLARELDWAPSMAERVVDYGHLLLVEDMRTDALARGAGDPAHLGIKAFLGAPMILDGIVVGAFCVADVKPRFWWPEDETHITDLAAAATGAIHLHEASVRARADSARIDRQSRELEAQAAELATQATALANAVTELQGNAHQLSVTNFALRHSETRLRMALDAGGLGLVGMGYPGRHGGTVATGRADSGDRAWHVSRYDGRVSGHDPSRRRASCARRARGRAHGAAARFRGQISIRARQRQRGALARGTRALSVRRSWANQSCCSAWSAT